MANRTLTTHKRDNRATRPAVRIRSQLGRAVAALCAALLLLTTGSARATDGFWVGKGSQAFGQAIWGGNANWLPSGQIANLAGGTAYFTNTFVNGYNAIYNVTRTIGNIWFTDPADGNDFFIVDDLLVMTLQISNIAAPPYPYPLINVTQPDRTLTIQTVIAGTNGLAKIGAGTLVLTNINTYTGFTVVSNGTLKLATASYATTAVIVNGSATNSVMVTATGGGQLTIPGPWTNADNSAQIIDYGINLPSTNVAPLSVASLALGTNVTLQIKSTAFVSGQSYPLITWASNGPATTAAFATLIPPPGVSGNLSIVAGTNLYFTVTASREPLTWNTGNGVWDTNTANWLNASLAAATYIDPQDLVVFDDAGGATGNPTITLNSVLSPVSVTMMSTNHNYTVSGPGGITGAGSLVLDPANTKTLTLATTNTYRGGTTINAGTLQLGAANVLPNGLGLGKVTVNAGGTLDLNTFSATINSLVGSGVVDTVAGGTATLTIGNDNSSTTFPGIFQNTAGTLSLVKNGTGLLDLSGANTFTGSLTINGGQLTFDNPNALATVTNLTLVGGTVVNPTADNSVINGTITLVPSGTNTTVVIYGVKVGTGVAVPYPMNLNGPITGVGNLTFQGGDQNATAPNIYLNAHSTYTGSTLITCDPNASEGVYCFVDLGTNNALPPTTVLTLYGSTGQQAVELEMNGYDQSLAGLTTIPASSRQIVDSASGNPITGNLPNLTLNILTNNYTFGGILQNELSLTLNGPGTEMLTGTNNYAGATTINSGILQIAGKGTLGPLGSGYDGVISISNGAALLLTSAQSTTLYGDISGGGGLTNTGSGLLTISSSDSLPNTTVGSGSALAINQGEVNALTVNPGGTLELLGLGQVTNLMFAGAGTMDFDVQSGAQLTVVANNGLANNGAAGSITINIINYAPPVGTYTLIAYNGTLQGSGFSAYQLGSVPSGGSYALTNTAGGVQLIVGPVLVWTGAQSHEWTTTPVGGLMNWSYTGNPSEYSDGSTVQFDDTVGSGFTTVDISGLNVYPNRVFFEANSYNYTLQGSQGIAGPAWLVNDGQATLTILNNNTYTGQTVINAGVVQVGTNGTSGWLGSGAITDSGDLQFNRSDNPTVANAISGAGTLEQEGTGNLNLTGTITGPKITVANGAFTEAAAGVIAGASTFTNNSPGTSTFAGTNSYSGATAVDAGELDILNWSTNTLGTISVGVATNATLGISGGANLNLGANSIYVGAGAGPLSGTVNQTGGSVTFNSGNALLIGNVTGSANTGTYNLSGGTLSSFASTTRGVMLGVNVGVAGNFNLSGAGNLSLGNAILMVGRTDAASASTTNFFGQTGGTATVGYLTVGGTGASTNVSTLSLTGGSFVATNFTKLAAGTADTVAITNGGTAQITLPAFPNSRGAGSSNFITFDFTTGYLSPLAASASYLPAGVFNNAYLTANGAKFNVASANSITVGQVLQDQTSGGTLTKSGAGTLTLSATNTYTGATTITAGTLTVGTPGQLGNGNYAANIINNGVFNYASASAQTLSGVISGTGSLTDSGTGTLTLTGANTYTNATTISAGALVANGAAGVLPTGSAVSLGAAATLQVLNNASGTIAQSNNITLSAAGTTDTIAVGNAGGATTGSTVAFGALNNGGTNNALSSTINFTGANGYLESFSSLNLSGLTGGGTTLNPTTTSVTITGNVTNQEFGTVTGHFDTLTLGGTSTGNAINGVIADNVNYASVGNGDTRVTMSGTGSWTLNGTNTYHGPTAITSAGVLTIGGAGQLGGGNYAGTISITTNFGFNYNSSAAQTLSGVISGGGGLKQSGPGTLTLTAANTYTNGTTINAGTLLANNLTGSGTGTGTVTVNSGGTLGGLGTIGGAVTNNAGGTLVAGAPLGALTLYSNLTLKAGSTNTFAVNGSTPTNSAVVLGAAVTYGGVLNIVTNGTFTPGQTFTLFSGAGAVNPGNFASLQGSPGGTMFFTFTNGVLSVGSTGPSGPAHLTNSVTGSTLSLSWPAGQGWRLQTQTNSLSTGLSANWVYVTDGTVSSTNLTVDRTQSTVFYRLVYP